MSCGEWQNAADLLNPSYLQRFTQAHTSSEVVKIWTEAELKAGKRNIFTIKGHVDASLEEKK